MSFMQKMIDETQMPITPERAFKEKSTKLLILRHPAYQLSSDH